jgi:hypothetical protein
MKRFINIAIVLSSVCFYTACKKDFLDKEPLGQNTELNFYNDPQNAALGINAIYDAASWDEGPNGSTHNYDWMFGDVLSSDAAKGSEPNDFQDIADMEQWKALPTNGPINGLWRNQWTVIYRANTAIKYLPDANIESSLKNRLLGEAHFMRAYGYYHLARVFGGLPLFNEPVKPSEFGKAPRSSFAATFKFIEDDWKKAATLLPEKNQYAAADLGRATAGAAKAYLARIIAFQLGTDNGNNHTWQEVYDLTKQIISSGQYSLSANFAELFEDEGENNVESIFEIQFGTSTEAWGPIKSGTSNNIIQNCRKTWGWGFNNPTTELAKNYEPNDPRLACTMYKDGDIVLGVKQTIEFPKENATGYLNRKAAVVKPAETKASAQNIRKLRYAEVLLLNAEAAYYLNKFDETINILNQIRARAKQATLPKGSKEGSLTYEAIPAGSLNGVLEPIANSVTGTALLDVLRREHRTELAMEALRFWDEVRWGVFFSGLPNDVSTKAKSHSIAGSVNSIPVLPIPLTEVESWGLTQNPGY